MLTQYSAVKGAAMAGDASDTGLELFYIGCFNRTRNCRATMIQESQTWFLHRLLIAACFLLIITK